MRIFIFLLLLFVVPFSMAESAASPEPEDGFWRAVSFICNPPHVDFVPSADQFLLEELKKNPRDVTSSLLLGLSYAYALKTGRDVVLRKSTFKPDVKVAKRLTRENAETLLRTALDGFKAPWRTQDKERFEALKQTKRCGFSSDTQLAGLIAAALRDMNPKRFVWMETKTRTLEEFEGYFLLGPASSIDLRTAPGESVVYDVSGRKPYVRRSFAPDTSFLLEKDRTFSLNSDYVLRVKDAFELSGAQFFYVLVTSDVVFTDGLKGKRIALEAGHFTNYGTMDPGSVYSTLHEVDVNKNVRSKLLKLLTESGALIVPEPPPKNRDGNEFYGGRYYDYLYDVGWKPYVRWVAFVHKNGQAVDAFVSIHHNVRTNLPTKVIRDFTEAYFGPKSQSLARPLVQQVRKAVGSGPHVKDPLIPTRKNLRTVYIDGLPPEIPRVLLEVQFTKKVYEKTKGRSKGLDSYAQDAAQGIYRGLVLYFKGQSWPDVPEFDTGVSDK
ncbi:MAG TPA: N-acetylmuramoyl-L-alanine amidase [Candidatus Norongarragalinales archaeon]|nr:N-acetylmuramoyl-L-alanine amidase [Candidatus Norongarragalinales archaeon]